MTDFRPNRPFRERTGIPQRKALLGLGLTMLLLTPLPFLLPTEGPAPLIAIALLAFATLFLAPAVWLSDLQLERLIGWLFWLSR